MISRASRLIISPVNLLLAALLLGAPQDPGFKLPVEETVLDNGMRVLVVVRRDVPRLHCSLWWRVGSVHERPGLTGLSHFFEHMMFMGTETIGTTDAKKDAVLNAKIEALMAVHRGLKLRRLEARRRGVEPNPAEEALLKTFQEEFRKLAEEQKKITVPEQFSNLLQAAGGTNVNASTSHDRTNYFVELPANKAELFFWLESDRFRRPVFRGFYSEREVVKDERLRRVEATPTGAVEEAYWAMLWQAHPYRWPVLGWTSDIDQYSLADAQEYFRTHYAPANATAVFVGDSDPAEVRELARRYFGRLPRVPVEREPVVTQEPDQAAERRIEAEADAEEEITVRWHGPSGVHRDTAACDLLMSAFDGRSGRLYRPLVEERKLALDAGSGYWSLRYGGVLQVGLKPREGADFAAAEGALNEIVEAVRREGVTDRELRKARNQQVAGIVRGLKTNGGIAHQLGYFETIGTWRDFFAYMKALEAVTAADVKRCAEKYLRPEGRNVLVLRRKK